MPRIEIDDVFGDVFPSIARDGAGLVEIGIRLQKGLAAVATSGHPLFAAAARRHAQIALMRALDALTFEPDRELLRSTVIAAGDNVDSRNR